MTIFEAKEYDPRKARRRNVRIAIVVTAVVVIAIFVYLNRNWPQEHLVSQFFTALENKDYEKAYGLWVADKNWKQHPQAHANYSFGDFYGDWGPGGEWGLIRTFHVEGSANPKDGSGVVVVVMVNQRAEKARIWVENKDKSLTFSPY